MVTHLIFRNILLYVVSGDEIYVIINNILAISWQSVLLVDETTDQPQVTLSHNVAQVHLTMREEP
jgi:hypothetical protein